MIDSMKKRDRHFCITLGLISSDCVARDYKASSPGPDLSDKQLQDVAKTLRQKWEQAALHLGLKKEDLDEIKNEKKDEDTQIRNMLRLWKDRRPGKDTAQDLLRGLEDMKDLPVETRLLLEASSPGPDLSDKQLRDVAKTLRQKWEQAALHLGLKNEDLDKIKNEKKDEFMQRRNMLRLWKDRRPGKATAQDLLRGLEDMKDLPVETRLLLEATKGRTSELILSSEQFKTEKLKDRDNIYAVMAPADRTRMALVITNVHFEHLDDRDVAEKDEQDMSKLLISLGYNVEQHRDLSGVEMDEAVERFSKDPRLTATDSVFVVIMSHGVKGAILGVRHCVGVPDQFPIDNIYKHLDSARCPKLLNKPKVIIIQACRGVDDGSAIVMDGPGSVPEQAPVVQVDAALPPHLAEEVDADIEEDAIHRVHKEKDMVSLLSCTADTVSYRHSRQGSFFIQHLVEIFNRHAHGDHIDELFRKVLKRFEDEPPSVKGICTLTRKLFLIPEASTEIDEDDKEDEEEMQFKSHCEKCKAAQQVNSNKIYYFTLNIHYTNSVLLFIVVCFYFLQSPEYEKVTPTKISKWSFQVQLEGKGTYECSATGLVFEVSEQALVCYSVLSWSESSEFLGDSWRPAGSIYDVNVVNKDPSVLQFIHFPHSLCLAEPMRDLSFSVLHVKDRHPNIEPTVDFTASHVRWRVSSLSLLGLIRRSLQVKHHALVLIYEELNNKDFIVQVYLGSNSISEIKAIEAQVNKSSKNCKRIYKPANCRLVAGKYYHLTSEPVGEIEPSKIMFTTEVLAEKVFSDAHFGERPPVRLFLMASAEENIRNCHPLWSATITKVSPTETKGSTSEDKKAVLDPNIYKVNNPDTRTRMALLITNVRFAKNENYRHGAEKDEEDMHKLLISLGYNVEKQRDLSGTEMDEAVERFSKDPRLAATDSVFVVIMSHGVKGAILGVHHCKDVPDQFPIDNIYKHLGSANCPHLEGKPKVIIIQACRGVDDGSVMVTDGPGSVPEQAPVVQVDAALPPHLADEVDADIEEDAIHWVHKEKDFVSLLSCTAGPEVL
ncbi:unnamed protein product [Gadus morhua 'NCC']